MTLDDTLDLVVGALHRADVDFMVTGSLASSYHGMPRSTGARGLPIWIATAEDVILVLQAQAEALDRPYLERWVRALDVVEEWQTVRERGSDDRL